MIITMLIMLNLCTSVRVAAELSTKRRVFLGQYGAPTLPLPVLGLRASLVPVSVTTALRIIYYTGVALFCLS